MNSVLWCAQVDHLKNPIDDWKRRVTQEDEDQPRFYYRLEGLLPGTAYELEVRARNDIGWSPVARQFFSTDPGQLSISQ